MRISKKKLMAILATLAFAVVMLGIAFENFFVMWLGWGLIFVGLEAVTVVHTEAEDTLSEQVQLGTLSKNRVWSVIWKSLVGTLIVWLFFHLVFGL